MQANQIINFINQYLEIQLYRDFCPNGLQVEGKKNIQKIALGVSATEEFIQKAIEEKCDLLIVHHGLFWNKDSRVIKGHTKKRLKLLLDNDINLVAYHLPLDYHQEVGNNVQLAKRLGFENIMKYGSSKPFGLGISGTFKGDVGKLKDKIELVLERTPYVLEHGNKESFSKVGIITGGAQGYFLDSVNEGVDCFITGEMSEFNDSLSKEYNVPFIAAGHYHTEMFGVQALGKKITEKFNIPNIFLKTNNYI